MCVLRASGAGFDVDGFMKDSGLSAYRVYRKGERPFPKSSRNERCFEKSGLKIDVSDREWDDLPGQIQDAVDFLRRFRVELEWLVAFAGVEEVWLDFPCHVKIGVQDIVVQGEFFPPVLLREVGSLGIGVALSLYPPSNESDAANGESE